MPNPRVVVIVVVGGVAPRVGGGRRPARSRSIPSASRETRSRTLTRGVDGVRRESRAKPGRILHALHGRRRVEDVAESSSEFSRGPPIEIREGELAEQRRRRRARKSRGSVRDGRERGDGGDDVASVVGVDEGMRARAGSSSGSGSSARVGGARARGEGAWRPPLARLMSSAARLSRDPNPPPRREMPSSRALPYASSYIIWSSEAPPAPASYHHRAGRDRDARGRGEMRGAPAARKTGRRAGRSTRATTRLSRATVGPDRRARARRRRSALLAGRIARGEHQRRAATLRDTCALFTRARAKK